MSRQIPRENDPLLKRCFESLQNKASYEVLKGRANPSKLRWDEKDQKDYDEIPLSKKLEDPYYLGATQFVCTHGCGWVDEKFKRPEKCPNCGHRAASQLFPPHERDILSLWEARRTLGVIVAIFQEGIGSGKTTKFAIIMWLLIAEVLTRVDPIQYYGLMGRGQGVAFVCMSRNESLAKEVTFLTLLPFFNCQFFRDYFPPQVDLSQIVGKASRNMPSRLRFPKNVVLFPGTGESGSAIGYNIFGGGVDEVNYMEQVERSKKAIDGAKYDAAMDMYVNIRGRMKSRFDPTRLFPQGKLPGLLVMFSNPKHAGDFTSRMEKKAMSDPSIFFRKRATWEAHPPERFCGKTFKYDVYQRRIVTHPSEADLEKVYNTVQLAK